MEGDKIIRGTVVNDGNYERFVQWLTRSRFPPTKMTLATFKNTGRGMMATSDIAAGEVIVRVPKSFLISNDALYKTYGPHSLSTHQLLALHLVILCQDQQCWWKPYLDLLPSHFNTLPVTFPSPLFDTLPDHLAEEVTAQRNKIKSDYQACLQFLKTKNNTLIAPSSLSFKLYQWAWLCVNTRCIHVSTSDKTAKGGNIAMAPLLDFLNHTSEARIESGFNSQTQSFEIKTLIPYRKGEQVFINYGPHDNQAIFKEYGFVLPQNEYNFVSLDNEFWSLFEETEPSQKSMAVKRRILANSGYEGDYTIKKQDVSFRLLCALRLLAIKGADQPSSTFQRAQMEWQDVIMGQSDQIDEVNERMIYHMLKSLCTKALQVANKKQSALQELTTTNIHHPFALLFLRQIWKESCDILQQTIQETEAKIHSLKV